MEELKENKVLNEIFKNYRTRRAEDIAVSIWQTSVNSGRNEMMLECIQVDCLPQLIDVFRRAGIETFVVTDREDHLITKLAHIQKCGCKMMELCTIKWQPRDDYKMMNVHGIRFKVGSPEDANDEKEA